MADQLTIDGGSVPLGPPAVPPVVPLAAPATSRLPQTSEIMCMHCQMVAVRVSGYGEAHPPWTDPTQITVLRAICRITQTDGSTLHLCAQHATEHANRSNHHG